MAVVLDAGGSTLALPRGAVAGHQLVRRRKVLRRTHRWERQHVALWLRTDLRERIPPCVRCIVCVQMLSDDGIRQALAEEDLEIEPFADESLQPASYDFRVGDEAFLSGSETKIDVANKGLVIIDAGEFAVLVTRERVRCGAQIAAQIGLCSPYARQGLTLLSGPQIDPGFDGVLIVRVTNLAPKRITLAHEAPFLTVQFFKLNQPVSRPYAGSRQGQTGLQANDIEDLSNPDSPTLGGMVKSLTSLARDVSDLKTSVKWMAWAIGIGISVMAIALTVVGLIAALK